jgi:RNA polymerase sigma-70 factor (ECF subfamily)
VNDRESTDTGLSALPDLGIPTPLPTPNSAEKEEFAAFYRRFTPKLVGFLMWQGAPAQLAADLTQEAMITAYRKWSEIRSPEAWIRKVASRELVRHFSRVEEAPVDQVPETANPLVSCPDELAEWEGRQVLLKLLQALPSRQRQVLAWSVSGCTPSEIAEELGIESATVRANLLKARRAVARRMAAGEEGA